MAQQTKTALERYLEYPETNQPVEFINGAVIVAPSPEPEHQLVSGNLYFYLRTNAKTGQWVYAPADVHLGEHYVQPDIFWIAPAGNCEVINNRWEGAPDLVIEILSPSTAKRDRDEKFTLYQQHAVREYWLVDPAARFVEVYTLRENAFVRQGVYGTGETFESVAIAITVTVDAIFGA